MKRTLALVFSFAFLFLSHISFSQQSGFRCGNPSVENKLIQEHPEILKEQAELEEFTQQFIELHKNEKAGNTYIIPVVFHVVHNFGPENISDAQIYDEMRILNEDFQKRNADTASTVAKFKPIAANCKIEFRLARKDPHGNCTNGIDRIQSNLTYNADDKSKLNVWPHTKYLNVWVVNSLEATGAAAYAYLPSTGNFYPAGDGIIIIYRYIGSIQSGDVSTSRALSHEVGHFFNLNHPWGGNNDPGVACGDDGVTDTPPTKGWTECKLNGISCNGGVENVQNFMDYSYCSTMFTNGQRDRMYAALNSSTAGRNNLWTQGNLFETGTDITTYSECAPVPVILPNLVTQVCSGSTVSFKSLTINGQADTWAWSFPGGQPSMSSDSTPVITYETPGTYNVTLTTSNPSGSNSAIFNGSVVVLPDTSQKMASGYSEKFENITFPGVEWTSLSTGNNFWRIKSTTGYSGTHCLELNNAGNSENFTSSFVMPSFNFTGLASPALYFRVAYVQKAASNTDRLKIFTSLDCGKTWQARYNKPLQTLASGTARTGSFVPSQASDWIQDVCNLSGYTGRANVRIKFEFTYGGGNNVYIDDINFNLPTGINELNRDIALSVFPNPTEGKQFAVSFNIKKESRIKMSLVSMDGREYELSDSQFGPGHQLVYFKPAQVANGIYMLKMEDEENNVYTYRIVIQ